jgi:hypothetical protein
MTFQEQIQQGIPSVSKNKTLRNRYQSRTKTQRNPFVRRKKLALRNAFSILNRNITLN